MARDSGDRCADQAGGVRQRTLLVAKQVTSEVHIEPATPETGLARRLQQRGRQLHDPSPEEDDMRILRIAREIAVPVAIGLCFAGLSTFAHYATV